MAKRRRKSTASRKTTRAEDEVVQEQPPLQDEKEDAEEHQFSSNFSEYQLTLAALVAIEGFRKIVIEQVDGLLDFTLRRLFKYSLDEDVL